jgi:SAM-dependent methyltransferase
MHDHRDHWDGVYGNKAQEDLSWTQPSSRTSARLVLGAVPHRGSVVDVGAGAADLVDLVLDAGHDDVTALDVSAAALAASQERLGPRAAAVAWVVSDVLTWEPGRRFDVWHDRAVFHFLTDPADIRRYVALVARVLNPGGTLVIGTFAPDGPAQCSGLPVARYSAEDLAETFGPDLLLAATEREEHHTPWGAPQAFTWAVLTRS